MKKAAPQFHRTGIYRIKNVITGKIYIGSTSTSFLIRWSGHRVDLRGNKHFNSYLQRAWNKYGEEAFVFNILHFCRPEACIKEEQRWLDKLRPYRRSVGYNLSKFAGSAMQGRKHSKESCAKMSVQRKGKPVTAACLAAATKATKGVKRSQEFCKKISKAKAGVKLSESHKLQITKNHWSKGPNAAAIIERSAAGHRGKKHSEKTKKKIGQSHWKYREDADEIRSRVSSSVSTTKRRLSSEVSAV